MTTQQPHHKQLASAIDLLPKSYELVKQNLNVFIAVFSVSALLAIWDTLNWFTDYKETWTDRQFTGDNWFGYFSGLDVNTPAGMAGRLAVLIGVAAIAFSLMQIILVLRASKGERPDIHDIWREFTRKGLRMLLLLIVMGFLILGGIILLVVPGVILLWRLFMAPYILLDQETGIKEALRRSWHMTRGYGWAIYSILLFGFVLALSGALPFIGPVASFLLGVAYANAPALRYWEIKNRPRQRPPAQA